jgi:hypothetical protein
MTTVIHILPTEQFVQTEQQTLQLGVKYGFAEYMINNKVHSKFIKTSVHFLK